MKRFIVFFAILSIIIPTGCEKISESGTEKTVEISAFSDSQTKTALGSENTILWQTGEHIAVFDGSSNCDFSLTGGAGTTVGTFSGIVAVSASSVYASYPRNAISELSGSTISNIAISSVQSAVAGSYDPSSAVMVSYSNDINSIKFHHFSSYIKVTPMFDCKSIEVKSNDGTVISGNVSITIGNDGKASSYSVTSEGSSSVTLSGNIKSGNTYLIAVLPTVCSSGFTLKMISSDDTRYSRTKSGSVSFVSGKILNFGSMTTSGTWTSVTQIDSFSLSRDAVGIVAGRTFSVGTVMSPSKSLSMTWSSSDASVASVSNGVITAEKPGVCTITANCGGLSSSCDVTVIASSESVYRHGYSQLSAIEQKAYNHILSCVAGFEANKAQYSSIYHLAYLDFASLGYSPTSDDVMRLTNNVINDVPEAFSIVNYIYRYDYSKYQYYIRINGVLTPASYATKLASIYAAANSLLKSFPSSGSDFDKVKYIHDNFIKSVNYGDVTGADAGNIVGGLINKRIVCEGYARSFVFLCQMVGLKAIYISGSLQTSSEPETWVNHSWNYVNVDGNWYMVDLTSDGGLVGAFGYRYFLLGKTKANQIHKYYTVDGGNPNTGSVGYASLPELSDTDYPMTR